MNIGELIKILQDYDPDRIVVLQKDSEGNGHSPLRTFYEAAYSAQTGEVGLEELTEDFKDEGYTQADVVSGVPALILIPKE